MEPIGGARVTFAEAVRELPLRGFDLDIIDTAQAEAQSASLENSELRASHLHAGGLGSPVEGPALRPGIPAHVGLFRAVGGVHHLVPVPVLRRPLALRFFGDSLYFTYHRYGPARRWLMERTFLRAR